MTKKISNINDQRRKKNPRTLNESAKISVRRFLNPKYDSVEEPSGLASGKTTKSGSFVDKDRDTNNDSKK